MKNFTLQTNSFKMNSKMTLVIGASEKMERYSNKAIRMLRKYHHEVVAIGNKAGKVEDISFGTEKTAFENIDTVTLYIGEKHQPEYYDYILSLNPKRIIFNPGTENDELIHLAKAKNIQCLEACTLVMLSTGQY
jgi:uncharacterized protein